MELTHRQKCQIAGMNADGSSIDEIAAVTGIDEETVTAFVAERNAKNGKKPEDKPALESFEPVEVKTYRRLTNAEKLDLISAAESDPNTTRNELAKRFNVAPATVSKVLRAAGVRVKGMQYDTGSPKKEKEPAPAATETSSEIVVNDDKTLQDNNSRLLEICQENIDRAVKDMLLIYDNMAPEEQRAWNLGEVFGSISRVRGEFV